MRIVFYVIFAFVILMFAFVIALMFSPKLKGKMMSRQVKSMKYMMDNSKEDIENISTNMADATKEGVETTTRAIRRGLTEDVIYCKHCGSKIAKDSKFCKSCGKEQ